MPPKRKATDDDDLPDREAKHTREKPPRRRIGKLRDEFEWDIRDPILQAFGIPALQRCGYIDYLPGKKPASPKANFFQPREEYAKNMDAETNNAKGGFIHPIFKRSNWPHLAEDDAWEAILPALRLASAFLCEPALQPFLEATYRHDRYTTIPNSTEAQFEEYPRNRPDSKSTEQIFKEIARLQNHVKFYFEEAPSGGKAVGRASLDEKRRFQKKSPCHDLIENKTFPVNISMDDGLFAYLVGAHDCNDVSNQDWAEVRRRFDPDARNRRVDFYIAVTLVHEVAHALALTSYEFEPSVEDVWHDENDTRGIMKPEPFYKDHRLAEFGWVLESIMFGGVIFPMIHPVFTNPQDSSSTALGLYTARFPGSFPTTTKMVQAGTSRGTPAEYGLSHHVLYPLSMNDIHRFFTEDFWQSTVPRYGLNAYRQRRWHGVRERNSSLRKGEKLKVELPVPQSPDPPREIMTSPPPSIDMFDPITTADDLVSDQ